jgi:hypothetical protein
LAAVPSGAQQRTRVLIVDDNEDSAIMLGEFLRAPGYDVTSRTMEHRRSAPFICKHPRSSSSGSVDVLFLERSGYPSEQDLSLAIQKDTGMDPGILAWLLRDFPVQPLPQMLVPLSVEQLSSYRDELAERLRKLSLP